MKPARYDDSNVRTFNAKLEDRALSAGSLVCVGLDPVRGRMPDGIPESITGVVQFCEALIDATSPYALAYKPNLAFFLAYGRGGLDALYQVCAALPDDIPVLLDCKTGDMAATTTAYATAWFDELGVDAITVNPYQGEDSLEPFLRYADKGVFVLTKTSNAGSGDLQDRTLSDTGQPLYEYVAARAAQWDQDYPATVGLVAGATWPSQLAAIRALAPEQPILLPGVGKQGGDLAGSLDAGLLANGAGVLCSSSRGIMYASSGEDFAEAAGSAAKVLRDQINDIRAGVSSLA